MAKKDSSIQDQANESAEGLSGVFRGIAAALRKTVMGKAAASKAAATKGAATKAAATKGVTAKTMVRQVGESRPLAFASEGAVAGDSMLPRFAYYGAWALSGVAITADIYNKYEDAHPKRKWQTALYWTAFHVPASLVVPAVIIHEIVHAVQRVVDNPAGLAKAWSPRAKAAAPVAAALLSIIPVVPAVDTAAEYLMEPTLGAYLGVEFDHHGGKKMPRRYTTHSFPGFIDDADNYHKKAAAAARKKKEE